MEKSFTSLNTGQEITPAAYIAEILCERKAKKDGNGTLPKAYWNLPKYKAFFKRQISEAAKLLQGYEPTPIIRAIKKSYSLYSLGAKWFLPKIEEENRKFKLEKEQRTTVEVPILGKRNSVQTNSRNLFEEL